MYIIIFMFKMIDARFLDFIQCRHIIFTCLSAMRFYTLAVR